MTASTAATVDPATPAAPSKPAASGRRAPEQVRFLSQAIALEEGSPPRAARLAVAFGTVLFVGAVTWAGATHVEKIAPTTGQILPSGMRLEISAKPGSSRGGVSLVSRTRSVSIGPNCRANERC